MNFSWLDQFRASDHPSLVLALSIALAFGLLLASRIRPIRKGGSPARRQPRAWQPKVVRSQFDSADLSNPLAQMEAVSLCGFERVPLLNKEEARLLPLLEQMIREAGGGHRLMAQTSLGEVIRPSEGIGTSESRRRGFASINAKRLDFALINRFGYLVAAIEYQGSGHYHTQSFMRDAVKREALRKAGVEMIEIPKSYRADEVRARLLEVLKEEAAVQA